LQNLKNSHSKADGCYNGPSPKINAHFIDIISSHNKDGSNVINDNGGFAQVSQQKRQFPLRMLLKHEGKLLSKDEVIMMTYNTGGCNTPEVSSRKLMKEEEIQDTDSDRC